jgi:hypothetical protein
MTTKPHTRDGFQTKDLILFVFNDPWIMRLRSASDVLQQGTHVARNLKCHSLINYSRNDVKQAPRYVYSLWGSIKGYKCLTAVVKAR